MTAHAVASSDFLGRFEDWGSWQRETFLTENSPKNVIPKNLGEDLSQRFIFRSDFKHYVHTFSAQSKYEVASLAQCVATLVISPFAAIVEFCRLYNRSINVSTCLRNICFIPKHIILSIFKAAFFVLRDVNNIVTTASTGVGFLAWHSGEWVVRLIKRPLNTVLSNQYKIRNIVYHSIGLTLLAAAMVFVPVAPIQMIALPIILGSIYGTINNQFSVRECPEYYTMGHYYDGTDLKGHAIKTNNVLIKPIVTGCYATTMVTKIAGVALAAVGTIPYTAAVLPVSYAVAMIAGVCLISLVAAHMFSNMQKKTVLKNLDKYATLIGIQWTENDRNKKWSELTEMRHQRIEQKRHKLRTNAQELEKFNKRLEKLTDDIEFAILDPNMPIKYIAGWQANNTRNGVGYLFAGGGTIVIAVSTVFLRIFAF